MEKRARQISRRRSKGRDDSAKWNRKADEKHLMITDVPATLLGREAIIERFKRFVSPVDCSTEFLQSHQFHTAGPQFTQSADIYKDDPSDSRSLNVGVGTERADHFVETIIDGLSGGERYNFTVRAVTEAGTGELPATPLEPVKMPIQDRLKRDRLKLRTSQARFHTVSSQIP
ncbi:hypothetical protein COOONC_09317 [Cooperia oncophora]